jgi:hypothetical protein
MKINLTKILIIFTVLFSFKGYGQETIKTSVKKITPEDLQILIGEWTGSLTYIDYSSNKPYTMPANLNVKQGKNANQLLLFNIFPNEPKANSKDKIILSKDGMALNKKNVRAKERMSDGTIQITTEFMGNDNKKKALIRNIYILGDNQFVIRKEVKFENTSEWLKRNEFNYKR